MADVAPPPGEDDPEGEGPLGIDKRLAIDDLLANYVLALDIDDVEAAVNLFTPDGEFATYGRVFAGHDQIRRMFAGAPRGLHLAGRSITVSSPDGARVRQQLVFFPADGSPHRLAIYDDAAVEVAGRWLFRRRECRFINRQGALGPRP